MIGKKDMHINEGEVVTFQGTDELDRPRTFYGVVTGERRQVNPDGHFVCLKMIGLAEDVYKYSNGIFCIEDLDFVERD